MKKLLVTVVVFSLILFSAFAEDYASMTLEELYTVRSAQLTILTDINTAIGAQIKEILTQNENPDSLGKIKDLFPDEQFAMLVRDKTGKFSIEQTVTQAELDTITALTSNNYKVSDLSGVSYLNNLKSIYFIGDVLKKDPLIIPDEICSLAHLEEIRVPWCDVASLPENIGNITTLKRIELENAPIATIPESIGNLENLTTLSLPGTNLTELPTSIGNCMSLKTLNISETKITELPTSIGNCVSLKTLDIRKTKISSLPESIWSLTLDEINMSGTSIK